MGIHAETFETSLGEVELMRARVEMHARKPAVIVVTSARAGDGKSLTAYSLAKSFARAGRRTALVETTNTTGSEESLSKAFHEIDIPLVRVGCAKALHSGEVVSEFFAGLRATYEYAIVDSATLLADSVSILLAANADGVLLAVRLGRAPTDDDDLTIRLIEQKGCQIVGVVATSPAAIDAFETRRAELLEAVPRFSSALRERRNSVSTVRRFESVESVSLRPS